MYDLSILLFLELFVNLNTQFSPYFFNCVLFLFIQIHFTRVITCMLPNIHKNVPNG